MTTQKQAAKQTKVNYIKLCVSVPYLKLHENAILFLLSVFCMVYGSVKALLNLLACMADTSPFLFPPPLSIPAMQAINLQKQ